MKLQEAMARAFVAEGVTDVFGMTGGSNIVWQGVLEELGTRFYQVRHEGAGLAMADGWARMRGTPGVCTTTGGPGAAQLATTMIVAARARTPLVAFCGDTPSGDHHNAQYMEQQRFAAAIEAGFVRIHSAEEVYSAVQRAFYLARTQSRPIMLNLPGELSAASVDDLDEYVPSSELIDRQPPVHPHPDALARAAGVISKSSRPVLIVGRGAISSGAGPQVRALADRIGALIATTLMAKNWLGDHPYHVGVSGLFATRTAIELFQESDCVIAVGSSLNQYTTEHGYLFPDARFIQIDTERFPVMGDGRAADVVVHAEASLALDGILELLEGIANHGYHDRATEDRISHATDDPKEYSIPEGTLDPRVAVRVLDAAMPAEIGMVLGGGQQNHFGIMLANRQRSWLLPNLHFACIGQGLTTAMGAIIAKGSVPAFLMEGDGGFMMHLAEFETAVRYQIPLFVAVLNDQGYGAEYHAYAGMEDVNVDVVTISSPDLGAVGRALGGGGTLVTTREELHRAARAFAADPAPTLVDVRIARDVMSPPNRRRHLGDPDA